MTEPINWQDLPSTATPLNAANLRHHDAWMIEQVEAAQASANAAADSAAEAAAPADDTIAALIASPGSGTRAQLDGRYATTDALTALQEQSASVEDLFVTGVITAAGGSAITGSTSRPVLTAPFPLEITSIRVMFWSANIAASDTNYWSVEARRFDSVGTDTTFATKTTKITGGQAIVSRRPWAFDAVVFGAGKTLAAADTLSLAFLPTGTTTDITGLAIVTVGYRPL